MKKVIQTHVQTQTAVNTIKEMLDGAVQKNNTVDDIQKMMGNFCYKCLQPKNPDCEICNGVSKNQQGTILFALQSPNAKLD